MSFAVYRWIYKVLVFFFWFCTFLFSSKCFCMEIFVRLVVDVMLHRIRCCTNISVLSTKCLPRVYLFLRIKTRKALFVRTSPTNPDVRRTAYTV